MIFSYKFDALKRKKREEIFKLNSLEFSHNKH